MRKIIIFSLLFILVSISMTSCSYENIDDTQVGVVIKRPYIIGSDGNEVLNPGKHCIAASSNLVLLDATPQKYKEIFNDLTTKDKSNVDFEIYFTIKIISDKSNMLYGGYGLDWYVRNLQSEFRREVRQTAMKYDMEPLTSDEKTTKLFEDEILEHCLKILKNSGVPVSLISVNMGSARAPEEVLTERNKTAAQKQREKTLVQENINLDQYEKNEKKRASGDKAYQNELNLTTDQYIKLKEIEAKTKAYDKASTVIVNESDTRTTYPLK